MEIKAVTRRRSNVPSNLGVFQSCRFVDGRSQDLDNLSQASRDGSDQNFEPVEVIDVRASGRLCWIPGQKRQKPHPSDAYVVGMRAECMGE